MQPATAGIDTVTEIRVNLDWTERRTIIPSLVECPSGARRSSDVRIHLTSAGHAIGASVSNMESNRARLALGGQVLQG
jgi:hypothetical protein